MQMYKKDGSDYEPSLFANMQAALDCFLKEASYQDFLPNSRHFMQSRKVLEGKARFLKGQLKPKCPNKSSS